MPEKLTQEDALARFRDRHGDRYDYSQDRYVDTRTKVVIICREHGPFRQGPAEHRKGQGCPPCATPRQTGAPPRPWNEVEPRLIAAHDGKYAYDGSSYRDSNSKIRATCPPHGDFWPQVASHLRGKFGCRKCSYIERGQAKRLSFEEWLRCARERCGERFEYDPESWNTHTNVGLKQMRFRCRDHGWQEMKANYHLQALMGWPTCGRFLGVVRGEPRLADQHRDTLLNPTVLIEVLSEATERYDRGRKAEHYRRLESLREYLLVAQHEPRVEHYRRAGEREWMQSEGIGPGKAVELASVGCTLALSEVYDGVF